MLIYYLFIIFFVLFYALNTVSSYTNISSFKNKLPKDRFPDLVKEFGKPQMVFSQKHSGIALWEHVKFYESIMILDESVKHTYPNDHCDFLYATVKVHIPFEVLHLVLGLSESIKYDRLKNELTVRCHFMGANVSTILLALKIVKNPLLYKNYYNQYASTIISSMDPITYIDLEKQIKSLIKQNQTLFKDKLNIINCS